MRRSTGICLTALLILVAGSANARPPGPESCSNPAALGLARTAMIDTLPAPRFGNQYELREDGEPAFLHPGEVVLTFDDGPLAEITHRILATLHAECTKAVFFSVGRMALAYPSTLERTYLDGHTVGGHTWRHANLGILDEGDAEAEIEKGFSAVEQVLNMPVAPFFRFPYLIDPATTQRYVAGRQLALFGITINSLDTATSSIDTIIAHTITGLKRRGKGIVLMHDIKPQMAAALPGLLRALKANGFRIVLPVPAVPMHTLPAYDARVAALTGGGAMSSGPTQRRTRVAARVIADTNDDPIRVRVAKPKRIAVAQADGPVAVRSPRNVRVTRVAALAPARPAFKFRSSADR